MPGCPGSRCNDRAGSQSKGGQLGSLLDRFPQSLRPSPARAHQRLGKSNKGTSVDPGYGQLDHPQMVHTHCTQKHRRRTIAIPIKFRRGLFQGDARHSSLCLCLAPLSMAINEDTDEYSNQYLPGAVTHMAYMDDIKLYGTSRKALC